MYYCYYIIHIGDFNVVKQSRLIIIADTVQLSVAFNLGDIFSIRFLSLVKTFYIMDYRHFQ